MPHGVWARIPADETSMSYRTDSHHESSIFSCCRCCLVKLLQMEHLEGHAPDRAWNRHQVPFPQPLGLDEKAEQPLQTTVTHPCGRALEFSRVEIKSCSHSQHHRNQELRAMIVHPTLLLRGAQANPQHVGRGRLHPGYDLAFFFVRQGAKRRSVRASDSDIVSFAQIFGQLLSNSRRTAIEKMTVARSCLLAKRLHEIGTADPTANRMSVPAS